MYAPQRFRVSSALVGSSVTIDLRRPAEGFYDTFARFLQTTQKRESIR